MRISRFCIYLIAMLGMAVFVISAWTAPQIVRDGSKYFIVDRHGERWDVTQAESLGFRPEGFQYGIGRYAFTPLDDTHMTDRTEHVYEGMRVIGVSDGTEAKAYSVFKLSSHEIANSQLGSDPIAVGY